MAHIRNWSEFQHYQTGRGAPPWIKLYRKLLNDKEWFSLPADAAKTLVNLWLLAAETNGQLPDIETIAFRLRIDSKLLAKHLSLCSHWISDDASNVLAECKQFATPDTETDTETEKTLSDSQANADAVPQKSKKENLNPVARELLSFLNAKSGKAFREVPANLDLITARLREGYSAQEIRQVVARKCREWSGDEKMAPYLRPETLFGRTKFSQYIGECVPMEAS